MMGVEGVIFLLGISVEKFMYDCVVEMSRIVVINEIVSEDFFGCEIFYLIVICMFEVVLDSDDDYFFKCRILILFRDEKVEVVVCEDIFEMSSEDK